MNFPFTAQQLSKAAALKEGIETLQHEFERLLGGNITRSNGAAKQTTRRMSAAAKARLAAIARAQWRKIRAAGRDAF